MKQKTKRGTKAISIQWLTVATFITVAVFAGFIGYLLGQTSYLHLIP